MRAAPPMLSLWPYKRIWVLKKKLKTCWFGFAKMVLANLAQDAEVSKRHSKA